MNSVCDFKVNIFQNFSESSKIKSLLAVIKIKTSILIAITKITRVIFLVKLLTDETLSFVKLKISVNH